MSFFSRMFGGKKKEGDSGKKPASGAPASAPASAPAAAKNSGTTAATNNATAAKTTSNKPTTTAADKQSNTQQPTLQQAKPAATTAAPTPAPAPAAATTTTTAAAPTPAPARKDSKSGDDRNSQTKSTTSSTNTAVSRSSTSTASTTASTTVAAATRKASTSGAASPKLDKEKAASKIAKWMKSQQQKKQALEEAEARDKWMIFSALDTTEEAEMLQLATFMQTLLDRVPNSNAASTKGPKLDDDEEETNIIAVENIALEGLAPGSKPTRKSFDFGTNKSAPLDIAVAEGIIEVCRQGGKLSSNTVMKLLRRTYALLKSCGNTKKMTVPTGGKLTVVGDLHGQLNDLIHILDEAGLPSPTNKFVFNGDFVDRGENGVEITCILMALALAEPENVVLNRGNHEDAAITRVYGFQDECVEKYDELTYGMFSEVFRYLPLFVLINDSIFVVHGGLFNNRAVTLADLDKINRIDYVARPPVPYPQCLEGLDNEGQWIEYYKQLQRDALWSDPQLEPGLVESERGAGVCFGPDVSKTFMENNNLSMIIRSHECVRRGFYLPYVPTTIPTLNPPATPLLATIFSASNYGDGDNEGAYMVIMDHKHTDAAPIKQTGLFYSVHHYKTSTAKQALERDSKSSLMELILKKKNALAVAFEALDGDHKGVITRVQWAETMQRVTTVKIRWLGLLASITPPESLTPTTINYRQFLDSHSVKMKKPTGASPTSGGNDAMLDTIYAQRKKLEAVFQFFDTNGDGVISPEEFRHGCAVLNEHLPEKQRLTDIDHMLELMDFDGNGMVDINEFFETFRILDEKFK